MCNHHTPVYNDVYNDGTVYEIIPRICEDVIHYVSGNRSIHHHTQVCNHHTPVYNDVYNDGTVYEIVPRICEDVIH